ncbi:DNA ligase [Alteromonas lipolytica]|nr:DNA ligase [Alteromonas lipolytica]GGF77536.1 ATP-dependent DNA ligase [Alteromonas lipolytica]
MFNQTLLLLLILMLGNVACAQSPALQLATSYQGNINVADYLVSEKLDGIRARWTGSELITRNGHPIVAPQWFTNGWPEVALDGELWIARGKFAETASVVLRSEPDDRWQEVKMMLFDLPDPQLTFAQRLITMQTLVAQTNSPTLRLIEQFTVSTQQELENLLDTLSLAGAEGLMLHYKHALYQPGRQSGLLKAKRYQDDEAKVIAHLPGKGKFSEVMGAILVESRMGKRFKIGSGFTLKQRQSPPPVGSWVPFKYYGLTQNGIPRFASFLHSRPPQDRPD